MNANSRRFFSMKICYYRGSISIGKGDEMKYIDCNEVLKRVKDMCINMNIYMGEGIHRSIVKAIDEEDSPLAKDILKDLLNNKEAAEVHGIPICQDTGMVIAFVEIGQEVQVINGILADAINEGVRQGYEEGYLRKSVVSCPLRRVNTGDNTPAIISYQLVAGAIFKITLAAKGFGSENMSAIKMLNPVDGKAGVKSFVIDAIKKAGSNCCPPIIVGIGIGGSFDKAAGLAKWALLRDLGEANHDTYIAELEKELLKEVNLTGIGPQGFGGATTALAVHIETFPTHIAGLPVAVNINCHASRHGVIEL